MYLHVIGYDRDIAMQDLVKDVKCCLMKSDFFSFDVDDLFVICSDFK